METLGLILNNKALVIPAIVVVLTQILKVVSNLVKEQKIDFSKLLTDGGMPSSHSATVCSLATIVALESSVASTQFAIALILAVIVMHDASGVRYEAGKHAEILNLVIEKDENLKENLNKNKKLTELLGHTKLEVIAGAITGIILSVIIYMLMR
ncbi:MAG: divergent PAP2 family protein [Clostridiales bacterium]|nr:divergent PAP2 family protein [Clostridiales bacterium]